MSCPDNKYNIHYSYTAKYISNNYRAWQQHMLLTLYTCNELHCRHERTHSFAQICIKLISEGSGMSSKSNKLRLSTSCAVVATSFSKIESIVVGFSLSKITPRIAYRSAAENFCGTVDFREVRTASPSSYFQFSHLDFTSNCSLKSSSISCSFGQFVNVNCFT